jgi:hypothetical protein
MQFDRLHPEAVIEMIGAAEEYERRQQGLGRVFLDEVRSVIDHIMQDPETGILSEEDGIRIAMTRRFPYSIMFDYRESPPWILTVYHQSRHPDVWKTRVPKR